MWESLIPGLGPVIQKLVNLIPDPNARAAAQAEAEKQLAEIVSTLDKEQIDLNKVEAANTSLLVSGWRPAAGWVCVISLGLYYWPRFMLGMLFWCRLAWHSQSLPPLPEMGIADVMGILSPLLGIGGYRMMEKKWGVAAK